MKLIVLTILKKMKLKHMKDILDHQVILDKTYQFVQNNLLAVVSDILMDKVIDTFDAADDERCEDSGVESGNNSENTGNQIGL